MATEASRIRSADIAALLYATDDNGQTNPLSYEAERLILHSKSLGGIDAEQLVGNMLAAPAFRDEAGNPEFRPLIDAISARLSEHENTRFAAALDAFNVSDGPLERLGEQAAEWTQRTAGAIHERISDGMVDLGHRFHAAASDTDRPLLERNIASTAERAIGKAQFNYGTQIGSTAHAVDTVEDFVALASATKRALTDKDYRDMLLGTARLYLAEVAEDPMKPLDDVQHWVESSVDQWANGLRDAYAQGKEAEYLGNSTGVVGIEAAAMLVPVSKAGKLAKALEKIVPDNAHFVAENLSDAGTGIAKGGVAAEGGTTLLRGTMGAARQNGQLLQLVEVGRATGNLDAMLKIGEFTPDELSWLLKHDASIFNGKVPFDEALDATLKGIDPIALSASAAGRKQLGDIGEAIMTRDLVNEGYTDIVSVQNKSGHGIDLVGRNAAGELEFFEVKTSARGMARGQHGDPDEFVLDRLGRAMSERGQWAEHRVPEGLSDLVNQLRREIGANGGEINAKWVRLNLNRELDSPKLKIDKSVETWLPPLPRERGAMLDESQPKLRSGDGSLGDPYLDRAYAASQAGDGEALDRIASEFTRSPAGQQMIQQGNELYAQQQLEQQQQREQQQQDAALVRTLIPQQPMA